ncbi:hypothetical protein GCM10027190_31610 [Spirosoma areae]
MFIEVTVLDGSQLKDILINTANIAEVRPHSTDRSQIRMNDGRLYEIRNSYASIKQMVYQEPH